MAKRPRKKHKLTKRQLRALAKGRRSRFKVKRKGLVRHKTRGKGKARKVKRTVYTTSEKSRRKGGRKSAKRVAAGKKAARTRKRNKAKHAGAARKGARRKSGRKAARRSGHRKSPKRVAAARKAARTRARRKAAHARGAATEGYHEKPRRRRRKSKRRNPLPLAASPRRRKRRKSGKRRSKRRNPLPIAASPRRRRHKRKHARKSTRRRRRNPIPMVASRRRYRRRSRNPMPNPIPNPMSGPMEFVEALLGVGFGFMLASGVDRWAAGHALTAVNGVLMDAPAAGQIYDSEAPALPLWSSWQRLAYAGGAVAAPMFLAGVIGGRVGGALKLMALGALVRTSGKLLEDAAAKFGTSQPLVQQLYAPEIAATTRLNQANVGALASAPAATFAGLPYRSVGAPRLGMGDSGDCCPSQGMITDPVADRNNFMGQSGQLSGWPVDADANGGGGCCPSIIPNFNPLNPTPDNSFPPPMSITPPPPPPPAVVSPPPPPPPVWTPPQPQWTPPQPQFTPPPAPPVSTQGQGQPFIVGTPGGPFVSGGGGPGSTPVNVTTTPAPFVPR